MDASSSSSSFPSVDDAAAAVDEAMYGCSASSSSSSIYHHPFSSFKFASSPPSSPPPEPAKEEGATLSSKLQGISVSPKNGFNTSHTDHNGLPITSIPPSPSTSYAESQHSMDEYEMDSPSSISSWNSFMSGHRGDLADVEDLELGEPELATVSEIDEEGLGTSASGNGSTAPGLPQRADIAESEDDDHPSPPRSGGDGLGFGDRLTRRRTINANNHGHASHHFHHGHGHGGLSHFSPRAGGHGLSHHSRWSSRTPASLAARRRKGRIAELAEEGEPGGINTTKMPTRDSISENAHSGASSPASMNSRDSRCEHSYPGTPASTQWSEFSGPPPLPVRSVSPSETVPVIPSPLCECINAGGAEGQENGSSMTPQDAAKDKPEGAGTNAGEDDLVTPTTSRMMGPRSGDGPLTAPTPRRGVFENITSNALARKPDEQQAGTSSSPPDSISSSTRTTSTAPVAASSPDTTPPSSPVQTLGRSGSLRSRRSSSPARPSKTKMPLRPCFSRRSSTQGSTPGSGSAGDGSPDREHTRGRCHVRFSPAPPQTIRTHSPVDYDRSSCPINNRLSVQDVEEMQKMEMEMGLLSAKCSAIAALTSCKLPPKPGRPPAQASSVSASELDAVSRPRRESTGGLLKGLSSATAASSSSSSSGNLSPAEHLRMQREKERERACRIAGIGTGLGGRNLGRGAGGQAVNPLIARFGLNAPPPPLPGGPLNRGTKSAPQSPSWPTDSSSSATESEVMPLSNKARFDRDATVSPPDRSRAARASSLQRTASEDRALRRSLMTDTDTEVDESEADDGPVRDADAAVRERGRSLGRGGAVTSPPSGVPALIRTDASPTPSRSPSPKAEAAGETITPVQSPVLRTPTKSNFGVASLEPDSYFNQQRQHRPTMSRATKAGSYGFPSSKTNAVSSGNRSSSGTPRRGGYDSPGSAYESGSEYDLIG